MVVTLNHGCCRCFTKIRKTVCKLQGNNNHLLPSRFSSVRLILSSGPCDRNFLRGGRNRGHPGDFLRRGVRDGDDLWRLRPAGAPLQAPAQGGLCDQGHPARGGRTAAHTAATTASGAATSHATTKSVVLVLLRHLLVQELRLLLLRLPALRLLREPPAVLWAAVGAVPKDGSRLRGGVVSGVHDHVMFACLEETSSSPAVQRERSCYC